MRSNPEVLPRNWYVLAAGAMLLSLAFIGFVWLGLWQLDRLTWKRDLISRVETRLSEDIVPAPAPSEWTEVNSANDEYRRVRASGHFLHDRETLVQAVTSRGGGFWLLTPLQVEPGYTILINRGFLPPDFRGVESRIAGQIAGHVTVSGLLRMSEPGGAFLRENDPQADRWYSRDTSAISTRRGLDDVAPFFIDADATPNSGGLPIGGLTVVSFRNNHLSYAITWFALALGVLIAATLVVRYEIRTRRASADNSRAQPS